MNIESPKILMGLKDTIERFWEKVDKQGEDECWNWKGGRTDWGHGQFWLGERMEMAHRISYIINVGRIPKNRMILHKCNNSTCVNPKHLYIGTQSDNMIQMRDEDRHNYKLNYNIATEIRVKYNKEGISTIELAKEYNISTSEVSLIIRNKQWKDEDYIPNNRIFLENKGTAKLTWKDINEIREEYNKGIILQRELAEKYNIERKALYSILSNKSWFDKNYIQKIKGITSEKSSSAKLTWNEVDKIREIHRTTKRSCTKLAEEFNVSIGTISYILNNKIWLKR